MKVENRDMLKENSFDEKEYEARIYKVREQMERQELDLLMIFDPANQFYLSGYQTVNQDDYRVLLLPKKKKPIILVWQLEEESVKITTFIDYNIYYTGECPLEVTVNLLRRFCKPGAKIGLEDGGFLNLKTYYYFISKLPDVSFIVCRGVVEEIRKIKSQSEIECLRQASKITQKGMYAAINACKIGNSENDIVAESLEAMFKAGSELIAFGPVVSSGYRSGIPHIGNRRKVIKEEETVFIELGGCYNRYTAPLMRTVYLGNKIPTELEIIKEKTMQTLRSIIDAIKPGISTESIVEIGNKCLLFEEFQTIFHYVYGYSVGVSFPPSWADKHGVRLCLGNNEILKPGMVFHLPISIRIPEKYCMGISETVLVTDDGCEQLTKFKEGLIIK
ncbi:MAG: Xaa-Pro peptidase family protein [Caldisericia bacterium]|nr:Xaa-Pro peptidase family protein [Caldisericia bacterium]MDD5689518.1 Xaa-Pro peptidase family protein [Caldisericia bacterium]